MNNGRLQDTIDLDQWGHDPEELRSMIDIAKSGSEGVGLLNMPLYVYDVPFLMQASIFQQKACDDANYDYKLTSFNSGGSSRGTFKVWILQ